MTLKIESGEEIVVTFFFNLKKLERVDKSVVDILVKLHEAGKLSNTNISNELSAARKELLDENKKH